LTADLTIEGIVSVTVSRRSNMPAIGNSYSLQKFRDVPRHIAEALGENSD
jgi:hypothetical protein